MTARRVITLLMAMVSLWSTCATPSAFAEQPDASGSADTADAVLVGPNGRRSIVPVTHHIVARTQAGRTTWSDTLVMDINVPQTTAARIEAADASVSSDCRTDSSVSVRACLTQYYSET